MAQTGLFTVLVFGGLLAGSPAVEAKPSKAEIEAYKAADKNRDGHVDWRDCVAVEVPELYLGYDAGGEPVGFAVQGAEAGFQDVIRLIFGYDPSTRQVLGMKVKIDYVENGRFRNVNSISAA